jgi:hypothetical protein
MSVMEYEIHKSTRHCAVTGRELSPGETFYSVLKREGSGVVREDYAREAWQGPPAAAIGWWKSRVPTTDARKMQWAPNEVMLDLFEGFADQPAQADLHYVLALLLVRRRVMRWEDTEQDEGRETMVLYCPRRDTEYRVLAEPPAESRVAEIQQELARLLFADAT